MLLLVLLGACLKILNGSKNKEKRKNMKGLANVAKVGLGLLFLNYISCGNTENIAVNCGDRSKAFEVMKVSEFACGYDYSSFGWTIRNFCSCLKLCEHDDRCVAFTHKNGDAIEGKEYEGDLYQTTGKEYRNDHNDPDDKRLIEHNYRCYHVLKHCPQSFPPNALIMMDYIRCSEDIESSNFFDKYLISEEKPYKTLYETVKSFGKSILHRWIIHGEKTMAAEETAKLQTYLQNSGEKGFTKEKLQPCSDNKLRTLYKSTQKLGKCNSKSSTKISEAAKEMIVGKAWKSCAKEHLTEDGNPEECVCNGIVRYGYSSTWYHQTKISFSSIPCKGDVFGTTHMDFNPSALKFCECNKWDHRQHVEMFKDYLTNSKHLEKYQFMWLVDTFEKNKELDFFRVKGALDYFAKANGWSEINMENTMWILKNYSTYREYNFDRVEYAANVLKPLFYEAHELKLSAENEKYVYKQALEPWVQHESLETIKEAVKSIILPDTKLLWEYSKTRKLQTKVLERDDNSNANLLQNQHSNTFLASAFQNFKNLFCTGRCVFNQEYGRIEYAKHVERLEELDIAPVRNEEELVIYIIFVLSFFVLLLGFPHLMTVLAWLAG